jgi:hypothetical protein
MITEEKEHNLELAELCFEKREEPFITDIADVS